ncbi:MAG: hypothetical protein ABSE08_05395 [Syntrophobacteraceae bacterium]|jgi:hypothetical protein
MELTAILAALQKVQGKVILTSTSCGYIRLGLYPVDTKVAKGSQVHTQQTACEECLVMAAARPAQSACGMEVHPEGKPEVP